MLRIGPRLEAAFLAAYTDAEQRRQVTCTLEHLLLALCPAGPVREILATAGANVVEVERELRDYIDLLPERPSGSTKRPVHEAALTSALAAAAVAVQRAGGETIDEPDLLAALFQNADAYAAIVIAAQGVSRLDVLRAIAHGTADAAAFSIARAPARTSLAVVLHNDPYTPMAFVVTLLSTVFELPAERAHELMLEIHHGGRGRVGVFTEELAHDRATRAMRLAEEAGFPLRCTVE